MPKRKLKIKNIIIAFALLFVFIVVSFRYLSYLELPVLSNGIDNTHLLDINDSSVDIDARSHLIVNMSTNQIIHEENMDEPFPIYSMTKSMLVYVSLIELEAQNRTLDEVITTAPAIDLINQNPMFSTANMRSNELYTIQELIEATMLPSGNDSTYQLALSVFGSHQHALDAMNAKAQELGFVNSHFTTVNGLDGEFMQSVGIAAPPGKNVMSAKEVYLLLQLIEKEYPVLLEITAKDKALIGGLNGLSRSITNSNGLISSPSLQLDNVVGFKTGANAEPYSFALSAIRKSKQDDYIASIIIGGQSRESLYSDMHELYSYIDSLNVINLQDDLSIKVPVRYTTNKLTATLSEPFNIYYQDDINIALSIEDINTSKLNRRINQFTKVDKGSVIGNLKIDKASEFISEGISEPMPVSIKEDVIRKNSVQRIMEWLASFTTKVVRGN